ncbi:MAG: hypothetical protein WBB28_01700 [Crinalium sp.]
MHPKIEPLKESQRLEIVKQIKGELLHKDYCQKKSIEIAQSMGIMVYQVRDAIIAERNKHLIEEADKKQQAGDRGIQDLLSKYDISYGLYWKVVKGTRSEKHCSVEGCQSPLYSRGMCLSHYHADWRNTSEVYRKSLPKRRKQNKAATIRWKERNPGRLQAMAQQYRVAKKAKLRRQQQFIKFLCEIPTSKFIYSLRRLNPGFSVRQLYTLSTRQVAKDWEWVKEILSKEAVQYVEENFSYRKASKYVQDEQAIA